MLSLNNKSRLMINIAVLLFLVFGCSSRSSGLNKENVNDFVNTFLKLHVKYDRFDDTLSERTLDNIISNLDPGKYYFYKKDVDCFSVYKHKIDDFVGQREYDFLIEIFGIYKKRYQEKMEIFNRLVMTDFDFTKDETMVLDGKRSNTPKTRRKWKTGGERTLSSSLLNYMSADKNMSDAREKLKKRYRHRYKAR